MALLSTPFGFTSTAADVLADVDLSGQRAIITGATSGIGVETARALAAAGADVILGVRRLDAGRQIASQITESTGNDAVAPALLDVADLVTVRDFAARFSTEPVHMLINNAGIMALPELSAHRRGPGDAVRHQLSRPLRPHPRAASCAQRPPAAHGSCRSAPADTCFRRWSSTTSTTGSGPTTRGPRTANPKQPPFSSPWE